VWVLLRVYYCLLQYCLSGVWLVCLMHLISVALLGGLCVVSAI
jgi:hypothetical protein